MNTTLTYAGDKELRSQLAWFTWNQEIKRFEVEVCGAIVATLRTLKEVKSFCEMHYSGFQTTN